MESIEEQSNIILLDESFLSGMCNVTKTQWILNRVLNDPSRQKLFLLWNRGTSDIWWLVWNCSLLMHGKEKNWTRKNESNSKPFYHSENRIEIENHRNECKQSFRLKKVEYNGGCSSKGIKKNKSGNTTWWEGKYGTLRNHDTKKQ